MKKIFAVILSLIILVLSAVSCSDQDDFTGWQGQTVIPSIAQSPDFAFDSCNPFSFSHTGLSAFVQPEVSFMEFISSQVRLFSENPVFVNIPVYSLIWHPPKA